MDHKIDVAGKRLGRVASEIAHILQGKKHASYDPKNIGTDRVLVSGYRAITVSGRKVEQKQYHRHTGYMGHLKTLTYRQLFERDPKRVLREAVRRMLPKNFLNHRRMRHLVFVEK